MTILHDPTWWPNDPIFSLNLKLGEILGDLLDRLTEALGFEKRKVKTVSVNSCLLFSVHELDKCHLLHFQHDNRLKVSSV